MARKPLSLPFSGKRLRQWRERAGLTQETLAEKCGLSRSQISRWETEEAKPELRALGPLVRGLSEALGRPADGGEPFGLGELLDGEAGT
jgi:transcriptional regulator with XRE-family HTH domain